MNGNELNISGTIGRKEQYTVELIKVFIYTYMLS